MLAEPLPPRHLLTLLPTAAVALLGLMACQPGTVDNRPDGHTFTHGGTGGDAGYALDDTGTNGGADGGADGGGDAGGTATDERQQTVYINEFMADNARVLTDGRGESVDWIELLSTSDRDQDLTGWTITDDLSQPDKQVLDGLLLPAGGTLLLYADGSPEVGSHHLSFSLHADGEEVGLYDADGIAVDLLTFASQLEDVSAARSWDGSDTWVMGWPATPDATNGPGDPVPDPDAAIEEVPASVWDDSELFSDDVLPAFALEISPAGIAALTASPYDYVQAALIYDGERYEPVGVRTKGENSWEPITAKPSLKIKLDKYAEGPGQLLGHHELTLQNMDNDYSMMHERIAYRLYRAAGVPAARATHATLSINDEPYGLYTHLETVDKDMIRRWFDDAEGTLFEQWDVDFYDTYISSFQLEYGADDRTRLQGLADAMENRTASSAVLAGADYLSWDSFQAYWAVGAVVGQFDAYPFSSPGDDCHVYDDPTTGVLHYLPHGMDEAFYYSTYNVQTNAIGILASTCSGDASCLDAWVAATDDALDVADSIDLYAYAVYVQDQIAPLVRADDHKPYATSTVTWYQDDMLSFIEGRRAELASQIHTSP